MTKRERERAKARKQARAELEFEIVKDQVLRRKEAFIARLQRRLRQVPNAAMETPCQLWIGGGDGRGYGKINFRTRSSGKTRAEEHHDLLTLSAHRVFLILKLCRPIDIAKEAAHECHIENCCSHVVEATHWENIQQRDERRPSDSAEMSRATSGEEPGTNWEFL